MFTPVILVCVANTCLAISGTAHPTKELCVVDMQSRGVAYVEQAVPQGTIVAMQCIDWGTKA